MAQLPMQQVLTDGIWHYQMRLRPHLGTHGGED